MGRECNITAVLSNRLHSNSPIKAVKHSKQKTNQSNHTSSAPTLFPLLKHDPNRHFRNRLYQMILQSLILLWKWSATILPLWSAHVLQSHCPPTDIMGIIYILIQILACFLSNYAAISHGERGWRRDWLWWGLTSSRCFKLASFLARKNISIQVIAIISELRYLLLGSAVKSSKWVLLIISICSRQL